MSVKGIGGVRRWKIYSEGFHDRDFLGACFWRALKFNSMEGRPDAPKGGIFAYERDAVRVDIAAGRNKESAIRGFGDALRDAEAQEVAGLVLCLDEDEAPTTADAVDRAARRIDTIAQKHGYAKGDDGYRRAAGNSLRLLPIAWCCDDQAAATIPDRQNLERLLVAALCAAYPERGPLVTAWLDSRVGAPQDAASTSKAFSWSHMAGWFPSPGGQGFFKAVWDDPKVAAALEHRTV